MPSQNFQFYCALCDREFKAKTVFDQDLHIRRLHDKKVIEDAVKEYTRVIFADMK